MLSSGDEPVVISGPPGEVVLFLFGREYARDLTFDGPKDAVAKVQGADLGF